MGNKLCRFGNPPKSASPFELSIDRSSNLSDYPYTHKSQYPYRIIHHCDLTVMNKRLTSLLRFVLSNMLQFISIVGMYLGSLLLINTEEVRSMGKK